MSVDFGDLEQQYCLPSGLLSAVQSQESGGDPNAVSPKGAVGAFQFMPETAKQYGIDPTDPDQAAQGAAMMFGDLSKKYNGDLPSMLAGYNWGQGNLDRKGLENAPDETQNYITKITSKLGKGTQYAAADTGSMTDASVDALPDPSTMTAAQIDAELAKLQGGQQLKDPSTMSAAEIDAELAQLQGTKPGIIDALQNNVAQSLLQNATGEQPSALLTGIKVAGNIAGAGLSKAGQYVPQSVKDAASSVAQGVSGLIPQSVKSNVSDFATAHPEAMRVIGAEGNLFGAEGVVGAIKDIGNAGQDIAASRAVAAKAVQNAEGAIPAAAVKDAAQNAYTYSENVGGVLHPDNFTNNVLDTIDEAKPKPLPGGGYTDTQKALLSSLNDYAGMRDHPMTLDQFQEFDKSLTAKEQAAMKDGQSTTNSRIIGQVQDKIRQRLKDLKESDVIGGKEGFDALTQHAIPLWSAQTKMADLEDLLNRAKGTLNPAQSTKTALNNLIYSPKFDLYPKAAQDAIKVAAERGNADELLGMVGSRLNPIVNSTLPGKALNFVTAGAARKLKNVMQETNNNKILSAMTDPVRDSVEKFSTLPESPYPLKPEVPVEPSNPYINPKAGQLSKFTPNVEIKGIEPEVPVERQGTASTYFAKGGTVKNREIHLTKQLTTKLGRAPSQRETELASYVGPHGVHRLLQQKDVKMAAHKMFPQEVVQKKRELFFNNNNKKPYTVEQIKAVL